nr:uncharacterized protein LOC112040784 [Quercus suber]
MDQLILIDALGYSGIRIGDIELQNPMNNGVVHQEESQPSNNDNLYDKGWNYLFLSSFVIAAIVDPLFFYIPVINDGMRFFKKHGETSSNSSVGEGVWRKYISYPIDFFVILPIPQVVFPFIFKEMRGTRPSAIIKALNAVVLFQYVPRILQIYLTWKSLPRNAGKFDGWIKAAFNFFLYILASHTYMRSATESSEEDRKKAEKERRKKKQEEEKKKLADQRQNKQKKAKDDIQVWILKNEFCDDIKNRINEIVDEVLEEDINVNVENLFLILPAELKNDIKRHLCLDILRKGASVVIRESA